MESQLDWVDFLAPMCSASPIDLIKLGQFWFFDSPVAQEGKAMSRFLIHPPGCDKQGLEKE